MIDIVELQYYHTIKKFSKISDNNLIFVTKTQQTAKRKYKYKSEIKI